MAESNEYTKSVMRCPNCKDAYNTAEIHECVVDGVGRRIIPLTLTEYNRITATQEITEMLDSANPWNEPAVGPARETKRTARICKHNWFPNEEYESTTEVFGMIQGNYDQFRENCVWLDEVAPFGDDSAVRRIRAYVYAVWASVEFGTELPDPICIPGKFNDYHTYYAIAGE